MGTDRQTRPGDISIQELDIRVRTYNGLLNMGVQTLGGLCQKTEAELLRNYNFGRMSLADVRDALKQYGLSLLGTEAPAAPAEPAPLTSFDALIAQLSPKQEKIIRLRFGIGCERSHTLREVGHEFKLGPERIRQIEAKALRRLRWHTAKSGIPGDTPQEVKRHVTPHQPARVEVTEVQAQGDPAQQQMDRLEGDVQDLKAKVK